MAILPLGTIPASGDTGTPGEVGAFTIGALRVNGNGTFARITDYRGPYILTICYRSANPSVERWPAVKIGSIEFNYDGNLSSSSGLGGDGSPAGNQAEVLVIQYNGFDKPTILLKASGGIIINDIYLTPILESD
jgi:hypothetical protein